MPTPGVSGAMGGSNAVWELDLRSMNRTLVHSGDPEPTDITVVIDGTLYWTCSSAGVIVRAKPAVPFAIDLANDSEARQEIAAE